MTRKVAKHPATGVYPPPVPFPGAQGPSGVAPAPVAPGPTLPVLRSGAAPTASPEEVARKTLEFQKKRAEAGAAHAQFDLGVRYLKGDGVPKDLLAARKWLSAAATNGHTQASRKLAELETPSHRPKP